MLVATFKALEQHLAPDEAEQPAGQPMVPGRDVPGNPQASPPADDRHHELEQTEVPRNPKDVPRGDFANRQPGRDRDGKRIHRQADRHSTHFRPTQESGPPALMIRRAWLARGVRSDTLLSPPGGGKTSHEREDQIE